MQTVHVRINDAHTGRPTPVRVRFTDRAGAYYAPFGRLTRFATAVGAGVGGNLLIDGEAWACVNGAFEIDLPPGEIRVQAVKGPEYRPIDTVVPLVAGRLSVRLGIDRRANLREGGWFSGDVRSHFLSPQAALLEGRSEDLAVVNVLARPGQDAGGEAWLASILEFSGQEAAATHSECLVAVNTYNQSPLGRLSLLHCHRAVHPLTVERINWTLADWCGQCHRKKGLALWSGWEREPADAASEGLANVALRQIDALEATDLAQCHAWLPRWHHLLNCGLRLPLAGGSGKNSNCTPLGRVRTFAGLEPGEPFTYRAWIEAIRAGRTFVSDGPLLWFGVERRGPGATVQMAAGKQPRVAAHVASASDGSYLELIANGDVVAQVAVRGGTAELMTEVPLTQSAWLAVRCLGTRSAISSPVYVLLEGKPIQRAPAAVAQLRACLSAYPEMLRSLDTHPGFATQRDRERLDAVFQAALKETAAW